MAGTHSRLIVSLGQKMDRCTSYQCGQYSPYQHYTNVNISEDERGHTTSDDGTIIWLLYDWFESLSKGLHSKPGESA